jgi:hypothetical protein
MRYPYQPGFDSRTADLAVRQAQLRAAANGSGPAPRPLVLPVTGNPPELKNG